MKTYLQILKDCRAEHDARIAVLRAQYEATLRHLEDDEFLRLRAWYNEQYSLLWKEYNRLVNELTPPPEEPEHL